MSITIAVCMTQLSCYLTVFLKNPGLACYTAKKYTQDSYSLAQNNLECYPPCDICGILKYKDVIHCADCNVCIDEYDHHCPWVGKCVGKGNIVAFNVFLGSCVGALLYLFLLSIFMTYTKI